MGYRIASFNLRNLGMTALGKSNSRDLKKIAEIIRKENFDVVALQEILSEGKAFWGQLGGSKAPILMELGSNWDFRWANVSKDGLTADQRQEGYAFLWNTKRLTLTSFSAKTYEPYIYNDGNCKDALVRLPYCIRLTPKDLPFFEMRLICIHTYYGNDTKEDRARRHKEIDTLLTQVYPRVATKQYSDISISQLQKSPGKAAWDRDKAQKPSYTILLGDYNMELRSPWKVKSNYDSTRHGKPEYMDRDCIAPLLGGKIITVQDQLTTLKAKDDEDSEAGDKLRGYAHDYDHFSYAEHLFNGVTVKVRRIDAVRKYFADNFTQYRSSVSDHVPIVMELDLLPPVTTHSN